ncbi:MAG: DNA repair protein RadC [Clostridia bacterium]|nr:DNA repair protein RadC [Clostridia bacterium]MDD4386858.1 DNA repair protein RadC [Clostridia bacterium]
MRNWNYFGSENLTNSELLAIVIKTGTKDKNCLDISRDILTGNKNIENVSDLEYLSSMSMPDLRKFKGIGRVKSIQIKAVLELSKRISKININDKTRIMSPKDIFDLINESYIGKKQEIVKTIILDNSNKVLSVITNGIGKTSSVQIGIKEIFSEPIKQMASGIVLVHNHPSGNMNPSESDIKFTKNINEYGNTFEIKLLDHVIIGKNEYISLKEKGYF